VAFAAPGDLDPSFSGDGRATLNLGGMEDTYWADVAATPDGGSVVVGTTSTDFGQPLTIGIAKLRSDGSFDPSFSDDGKLILSRGIGAYAYAVAAQPDGKIVISGTHDEGGVEYFDVVRVNADGTLDSSFGAGGFRSITLNTPLEEGYDVTIAPDGKIVAAGYAGTYHPQNGMTPAFADYDLVVVRLNSNGVPDTTFDGDGVAKPTSANSDTAQAVAVQPDGKIVVAGNTNDDLSATRLNTNGTLDAGFGTAGQARPDFPDFTGSEANGIALQPDGRIVLAGYGYKSGKNDLAVARLESGGALDPTFNDDGKFVTDLGSSRDKGFSAAIQTNGKIVVGGWGGANGDLYALRFDANGVPDAGFDGGDGVVPVEFASEYDEGGDVALQADGKILLSGVTDNNHDFAIARLEGDSTGVVIPPPDDSDTTAPQTTITKSPDNKSHKAKARYRFESSEPGSTFECAFDSKTYKPCDAGKVKYKHLDFGKHKFSVRATDAAGNTDGSPAKDKFKHKH
jgi:uncharacterized delta-60 repeat protein